MMSEKWYKVKNCKQIKIRKPKSIDSLLNDGFVVVQVVEKGRNTKITTHSPQTRAEYDKQMSQCQLNF